MEDNYKAFIKMPLLIEHQIKEGGDKVNSFQCELCDKVLKRKYTLAVHLKRIHDVYPSTSWKHHLNNKCLEDGCNSSFINKPLLIKHLNECHGKIIKKTVLNFESVAEFQSWFDGVNEYRAYVLQHTKVIGQKFNKVYMCCRSGVGKTRKHRVRKERAKGSKKLNFNCTSHINISTYADNTVSVTHFEDHYGHEMDTRHLIVPRSLREQVIGKLSEGAKVNEIMAELGNDASTERTNGFPITQEDVCNIKRQYRTNLRIEKRKKSLSDTSESIEALRRHVPRLKDLDDETLQLIKTRAEELDRMIAVKIEEVITSKYIQSEFDVVKSDYFGNLVGKSLSKSAEKKTNVKIEEGPTEQIFISNHHTNDHASYVNECNFKNKYILKF